MMSIAIETVRLGLGGNNLRDGARGPTAFPTGPVGDREGWELAVQRFATGELGQGGLLKGAQAAFCSIVGPFICSSQ